MNYIINTLYQLLSVLVPVIILPRLSRALGAEGIGLYGFNNSIVSYFVLFASFGSSVFGQREVAYCRESKEELSKVFKEVQSFRTITSIVSLCLYIIYVVAFGKNKIILIILSFCIINVILDISWFWTGLEEFQRLATRFLFVKVIYICYIFLFIRTPSDIYKYVLGEVLLGSFSYILLWGGLKKVLIKVGKVNPFRHARTIINLFIPSIAIQLYTVLDKTMLGIFSVNSYAENGYYEQAQGVIKSCLIIVTSLATVMSPTISACYIKNDKEDLKKYLYVSYRYVWFVTVALTFIISSVAPLLMPLFLGKEFIKTALLLRICSPLFIIIGLSNITGLQYFVPCNKVTQYTTSLICGSIINLGFNLILIPKYQAAGASIASVVAEFFVTLVQFIFVFKIGDLKVSHILRFSIKYLCAGVVATIFSTTVITLLPYGWITLIIAIIVGLFTYLLTLFILRDKLLLGLFKERTLLPLKIEA